MNDFKTLYIDLIDGFKDKTNIIEQGTQKFNYNELSKSLLDAYTTDIKNYWKNLIDLMDEPIIQKIESEKTRLGMRFGDLNFDNITSVVHYIADNIDINAHNKDIFAQIANEHPEWNESINWLVNAYNTAIQKLKPSEVPSFEGATWQDFAKTDAGWNYNDLNDLVRPLKNIDKKSYRQVRDDLTQELTTSNIDTIPHDIMPSAATDSAESQYTCKQSTNENAFYTRLIMPKYSRRLELEDLNRNFWVIGQTLSGLCDILFPEDPYFFKDVLEGILNELPQLWENIAYLWIQLAVNSQKPLITEIQVLFLPVYNDEIENYIKFDYFEKTGRNISDLNFSEILEAAQNKFKSLTQQYKNINLFIVPEFRSLNKQHNYYSAAIYPGAIFYNINTDEWINIVSEDKNNCYINLTDKNDTIAKNLMGTKIANHQYTFINNYQDVPMGSQGLFFGICRSNLDVDLTFSDNGLEINKFKIEFYDVSHYLREDTKRLIGNMTFTKNTLITTNDTINTSKNDTSAAISYNEPYTVPITKGWYGGELLTGLPTLNYIGDMKVITFGNSQSGSQLYTKTWNGYLDDFEDPNSALNNNWNNIIQNELSILEPGMCRFLLRRVQCVNDTPPLVNVFEVCDAFSVVYKNQAGQGTTKKYLIKADYSKAALNKTWPQGFDKIMVSAVQTDDIGKHSTVYLGRTLGNVALNNNAPEAPGQGDVQAYERYKISNDYEYQMVDNGPWDNAYIGARYDAAEGANKHQFGTRYKINYYGSLIKEQSGSSDLYQSYYEIDELVDISQDWILPPPASQSDQIDEVDKHKGTNVGRHNEHLETFYDRPYSTTGTFVFSPGSVDTSGGAWHLNPFKIAVIDRTYLYSSNEEDKVAYYYNCEIRREHDIDYVYAEFNCFKNSDGTQKSKGGFDRDTFQSIFTGAEGEKWIEGNTYEIDGREIEDKLAKLTISYNEIKDVLV